MTETPLLRTPLLDEHRALGARIVPFAGYSMPIQYEGVVKEHHAVRQAAGLFDVSHMGELYLRGPRALEVVNGLVTNDFRELPIGRAKYTVACNELGTILDDLIIYRLAEEEILVVCNASNRSKMSPWFEAAAKGVCDFEDATDRMSLLALQGPHALAIAKAAGASDAMLDMTSFSVRRAELGGIAIIAARTGYTGEDGFELFCANEDAVALWRHVMDAGRAHGLAPIGLGARDTLRLEACLSLYGFEIDETINPLEAGLGWVVKLDAGDFIGRDALLKIKAAGLRRKLVGLEMTGRGIARHDHPIQDAAGNVVGKVTSGSPGPTVGKNIALGYVPIDLAKPGTNVRVDVRGKVVDAVVVKTPFYKRQ